MDDGRTRALSADAGEPGRQWHSRARLLQVMSSLEIDPRIVVGNQPCNATDLQELLYTSIPVWVNG